MPAIFIAFKYSPLTSLLPFVVELSSNVYGFFVFRAIR
jgi:hypothetical protein